MSKFGASRPIESYDILPRIKGPHKRGALAVSGPGRRFKSSLPDQYFQAHKAHFWSFIYIAVDDFKRH